MQSLYDWIQHQTGMLLRHSNMTKAFAYLLKQWDALNEYCRNGWVEIDNNLCENVLRVVALGRRNYMFFGSDGGADTAWSVAVNLTASDRKLGASRDQRHQHLARQPRLLPWNVTLSVN